MGRMLASGFRANGASVRLGLLGLCLGLLPGCVHQSGAPTFKALATFSIPGSPAPCAADAAPERPDALNACSAGAQEASAVEPVETPRAEVQAALGPHYALATNVPEPPRRALPERNQNDLPLITGSVAPLGPPAQPRLLTDPRGAPVAHRGTLTLSDAVARAVLTYPEIRAHEARLREAKAGIDISQAALYPNADLRVAAGGNFSGSYEGKAVPYAIASNNADNRFDGGLILRQLLFDFGAAGADIDRAKLQSQSERFRLREKIDEIAWRTAQTYVKIHEHRTLLGLVDETIGAHQNLLRIVMAQEKEGHGTSADVNRVKSRVTDISTIRADVSLSLKAAEDQFERLTRLRPGSLGGVPNYRPRIPVRPEIAIEQVLAQNPRLASMQANNRSIERELDAQQANRLPKFGFELDTESKNFRSGLGGRTQIEARGMVAMRFKLFDGGLHSAQERQIKARIEGGEMLLLNEREQLEADIRQAYRAIESAGKKGVMLADGVQSAKRVRELYLEQFKAGKRTIFELLDGQMSHYTARRAQIESQFEIHKAVVDILRATGELTPVLSSKPTGPVASAMLTGSVATAKAQAPISVAPKPLASKALPTKLPAPKAENVKAEPAKTESPKGKPIASSAPASPAGGAISAASPLPVASPKPAASPPTVAPLPPGRPARV